MKTAQLRYQYGRLIEIGPENRAQVEGGLVLYTAREIDMTDSAWGHGTELEAGEYCRQYLILGREPIDVVYDEEDRVVHIFPSF
jgi:hypothetical protein